jgi:hypothetical protein
MWFPRRRSRVRASSAALNGSPWKRGLFVFQTGNGFRAQGSFDTTGAPLCAPIHVRFQIEITRLPS